MAETNPDPSTLNSQITDAVKQVQESLLGATEASSQAMADQVMGLALSLAMQNAVAQQQQSYLLLNAVTTAAVRGILDSDHPEEALRVAREAFSGEEVVSTLEGLKKLVDELFRGRSGGATQASGGDPEKAAKGGTRTRGSGTRKTGVGNQGGEAAGEGS